jgi:hypothetical protein
MVGSLVGRVISASRKSWWLTGSPVAKIRQNLCFGQKPVIQAVAGIMVVCDPEFVRPIFNGILNP